VTGTRNRTAGSDRALATVLFTDIVGSTEQAARLGDRSWKQLLATHDTLVRAEVDRFRGRVVKSTGDGVMATFDGPGRAIGCATRLRDAVQTVGLHLRGGLHTGEVELLGDDIGGISVHVAARVCERAESGQILVSGVVSVLVAGSGIAFQDQGEHELKGVPGPWRLFAVES
jgi:class 3 adenylate cyclase